MSINFKLNTGIFKIQSTENYTPRGMYWSCRFNDQYSLNIILFWFETLFPAYFFQNLHQRKVKEDTTNVELYKSLKYLIADTIHTVELQFSYLQNSGIWCNFHILSSTVRS